MQTDRSTPDDASRAGVEQWEDEVATDPACEVFSALAESHRRAGRPLEARRIAEAGLAVRPENVEGQIALGLAMMDLGKLDHARGIFSALLPGVPPQALDAERPHPELVDEEAWPFESPKVSDVSEPTAARLALGTPNDLEIDQAFETAESDPSEMMDANRVAEYVLEQEMDDLAFPGETRHETCDDLSGAPVTSRSPQDPQACEPIDDADGVRVVASLELWLQNIRRPLL